MATIWVREFTGGLDTRRLPETTPGGVLIEAQDGHITRGGEFEQRAAFVPEYLLPAGTVGLAYDTVGIVVFGHEAAPALPTGVRYQRLQHPAGLPLTRTLSFDLYSQKLYVVGEFSDGSRYHFYDGVRVEDWYDGRARASFTVTGGGVAPALSATGSFEITGGTSAPGTNRIENVEVAGVPIISGPIDHTGDNASTAIAVASAINSYLSVPDYTATATGSVVSVRAVSTGPDANGRAVTVPVDGDVSVANIQSLSGGAAAATSRMATLTVNGVAVTLSGVDWRTSNAATATAIADAINTFTSDPDYTATSLNETVNIIASDTGATANGYQVFWTLQDGMNFSPANGTTMNGGSSSTNSYVPGTFVKTVGSKVYSVSGPTLHFSGIRAPTQWTTDAPGAGFIDMSEETSGAEDLRAVARYQDNLAIFAESVIQIWYIDPDPSLNRQLQTLNNTGTASALSVTQFGDNDLFYLNESGLRSLRARDSSNSAATTDIGVPIDTLVINALSGLTEIERSRIFGLIEPRDGRFWLIIKDRIFVFSYFPGSKVSAWSTYNTGFAIEEAVTFNRRVYVRAGNQIYVYGGLGPETVYDETPAIARLPYLDANDPTATKILTGVDAAVSGVWEVRVHLDPANLDASDKVATIEQTSFNMGRFPASGQSTHIGMTMKSVGPGPHKLGSVVLHYEGTAGAN